MNSFFKPYEGNRPFLFISYAHLQSEEVVSTIRILHDAGWRLWYDEGIPAGSDWPANISRHMDRCEKVIFFLSKRALESPNCISEMQTAHRSQKPGLMVRLDDSELDERWEKIRGERPVIPRLTSPEERAKAILQSGFVTRRFHRKWTETVSWRKLGMAASIIFFLLAAGALGALRSGLWNPAAPAQSAGIQQTEEETDPETAEETEETEDPADTVVDLGEEERLFAITFPDEDQEKAIRKALGQESEDILRGQLAEIHQLFICGNMVIDSLDKVSFDQDGGCRVNGAPVIMGKVSDLSLFAYAVRLEELGLVCQPLGDLSCLDAHVLLKELSLAGSIVDDIDKLQDLPSLQILHLEHTGVRDLTPLENLPRLKAVTVSREMLPLTWSENARFTVILVP